MERTLTSKTNAKLSQNMTGGVCLTLVMVLSFFCVGLVGAIASVFLSTVMLDMQLTRTLSLNNVLGTICTVVLSMLLLSPLRLSIKDWYRRLSSGSTPLKYAFSGFVSLKKYASYIFYCAVRSISTAFLFFLPLIPSAVLFGVLRGSLQQTSHLDAQALWLIILAVLLAVLAIVFSIYSAASLFYVDYLFLSGKSKNPFKLFLISARLARDNKKELIYTIAYAIPHFMLCVLIIPIPFMLPKIKSCFAVHAANALSVKADSTEEHS